MFGGENTVSANQTDGRVLSWPGVCANHKRGRANQMYAFGLAPLLIMTGMPPLQPLTYLLCTVLARVSFSDGTGAIFTRK